MKNGEESNLEKLSSFLSATHSIHGLPSHVDDTVVDRFFEYLITDTKVAELLANSLTKITVETTLFCRCIHLRLLNKVLKEAASCLHEKSYREFVGDSVRIADCNSHAAYLSALLQLLYLTEVTNCCSTFRRDGRQLAATLVCTERVSVFVKKDASKYLGVVLRLEQSSDLIQGFVDVVVASNTMLIDCVSGLLMEFISQIPHLSAISITQSAPSKSINSVHFARLVARLTSPEDVLALPEQTWNNTPLKLNVIEALIANGCKPLIGSFLQIPSLRLHHVTTCLPYLSREERDSLLESWLGHLSDEKKCPNLEVSQFLSKIVDLSSEQLDAIFLALRRRFLISPSLLSGLLALNLEWGRGKFEDVTVAATIREALFDSEWDRRDSAIELIRIFTSAGCKPADDIISRLRRMSVEDENYFVRANAIRCAAEAEPKSMFGIAAEALLHDAYSEVRLAAAESLSRGFPESARECREVLPQAIQDCDWEVRREVIRIAAKFMADGSPYDDAAFSSNLLEQSAAEDMECGEQIRDILGLSADGGNAERERAKLAGILDELTRALTLTDITDSDEGKDCY